MEGPSIAHDLPELYRRVLDRIAALERRGHRHEADRVRAAATAAYSGAWDDAALARLEQLSQRAERVHDGHEQPRRAVPIGVSMRLRLRRIHPAT
jgi:hypothetical protein